MIVSSGAADQLHRQEVCVAILLDRVDRDDVGAIQRGERARLALEALDALRVGCEFRREHFEGHVAPERRVGADRLDIPRPWIRMSSRFRVAQVDERRLQSFVRELRRRPARRDLQVVGMRPNASTSNCSAACDSPCAAVVACAADAHAAMEQP